VLQMQTAARSLALAQGIAYAEKRETTRVATMRINVYSQELTSEVALISKESNTGVAYHAVQLILHSSPKLHHPPQDDDRSAITLWLPKSLERRADLSYALHRMADLVMQAPRDTGLD
jgi:hypothetical protein